MISLEDYKYYLINYFRWPIDNNQLQIQKRKLELIRKYPDEYLEKIINNTTDFLKDILQSDIIKDKYYKEYLEEGFTFFIDLGLHGGHSSDILYIDSKGRIISNYLIKKVLGKSINIEIITDIIERDFEDDTYGFDYNCYLYMQGFPDNLSDIKKSMFCDTKRKVRHL